MSTIITCADSINRLTVLLHFLRHVHQLSLSFSVFDEHIPQYQVFLISLDAFVERFENEIEILDDSSDALHFVIKLLVENSVFLDQECQCDNCSSS